MGRGLSPVRCQYDRPEKVTTGIPITTEKPMKKDMKKGPEPDDISFIGKGKPTIRPLPCTPTLRGKVMVGLPLCLWR